MTKLMFSFSMNRSNEFAAVASTGSTRAVTGSIRYFDDEDILGLLQERQRILNGTTGLAHVFPGDGNSLGRECHYGGWHDQDRPAGLENKAAGIESAKRIAARTSIADDDEIGRPRLARDRIGLTAHYRSPFRAAAARPDCSAKLLSLLIEQSFHIPQMRHLRSRLVGRVLAKNDRD